MYWQCSCGEQFEETGDRKGFGSYMTHLRKENTDIENDDEKHKCEGLYSDEGKLLQKELSLKKAALNGYVEQKKSTTKNDDEEMEKVRSVTKVKTKIIDIDLDPEIFFLYYITRQKYPNYKADLGTWINECVMQHYIEHPELGLNQLFKERPELLEKFDVEGVVN